MRAMMKWAAENNHLPRRPKVWVPRAGENRDRVLTPEEAQTLVASALAGDPHISLFVRIAFATAARHMAILDLEWARVDFDANTIEFDLDLPPDPMSKAWRKGRAKVYMGAALRAALELAKKGRRCDHVIEHGGKRLVTVRAGFFNAVKRAGLAWQEPDPKNPQRMLWTTDCTPHTIRHTVLTWLEEGKVDPRRAQQLAGHKDLDTTQSIYQHPDAAMLKEAVELLEERLLAPPEITSDPARDGTCTSSNAAE
jgi:integrase